MSLDPCPSDAELLRRHAEQQARNRPIVRTMLPLDVAYLAQEGMNSIPGASRRVEFITWDTIIVRIPWSALVSDNRKYGVINGKLVAQKPYRVARRAIHALAVETMNGRPAADIPLRLVARVYVPDNRVHDVVNFSKAVHDALKGTVFTDDRWLYDARWIRAGVDVDAPRCELTISPLPEAP